MKRALGHVTMEKIECRVTSNGHMSVAFDVVECPSLDITKLCVLKVRHRASLVVVVVESECKMMDGG